METMKTSTSIKKRFFNSLKRGTGEAYLIAIENPTIDFSKYIIKGVLKNYAYDGQSESSRAQYILDLYSVSLEKEKIRNSILNGLATEQDDTWSLTHLFGLAKLFVMHGDQELRQAIYDRFLNNPIEYSDWVGCYEILELDGLQGLIYIAEKYGIFIEQNPDYFAEDWIISDFQEDKPELEVIKTLENLAMENKYIRIYLENIKRTKESQEKNKNIQIEYKDIVDELLNSKPYILIRRKINFSEDEVTKIAEQLIIETDNSKIEKLLHFFNYYKFPFDSEVILNFAKQKKSSKNWIVDNAIGALKHLRSKSIREFAIEKIYNSRNPFDYLEILTSNYQSGDFKILTEIATKTKSEDKIENLAGIFTEIFKANKTNECKEPLELLYYKMNCGICRNQIIKILIDNDVLSDKIRNEIQYDCNMETRELYLEKM